MKTIIMIVICAIAIMTVLWMFCVQPVCVLLRRKKPNLNGTSKKDSVIIKDYVDLEDKPCTCQLCNQPFRCDFNIPEELWNKISHGKNLLCPVCIAIEIESLLLREKSFDYFHLIKLDELNKYKLTIKEYPK